MNPMAKLFSALGDVLSGETVKRSVSPWSFSIEELRSLIDKKLNPEPDPEKGNLGNGYVQDIYIENGLIYALIRKDELTMFKALVTVIGNSEIEIGELIPYEKVYLPKLDSDNSISGSISVQDVATEEPVAIRSKKEFSSNLNVIRQKDGKVRWFAMPACTAVINRSGEIDSTELFDSFIEHVQRSGEYPTLDFYHLGEKVVLGKADWIARDGYALMASGTFEDTDIAMAAAKSLENNPDYWGLSIAYLPTNSPDSLRLNRNSSVNVYTKGVLRFISLLPEKDACSLMTHASTNMEVLRMNPNIKDALKVLVGDDDTLLQSYVDKVDSVNRTIDSLQLIAREAPEEPKEPVKEPEDNEPVLSEEETSSLIKKLLETPEFINAVGNALSELVKSLPAPEEPKEEPKEPETPSDEEMERSANMKKLVELAEKVPDLLERVNSVLSDRDALQERMNNLPSRLTVHRARALNNPEKVNSRASDLSAKAQETLDRMNGK